VIELANREAERVLRLAVLLDLLFEPAVGLAQALLPPALLPLRMLDRRALALQRVRDEDGAREGGRDGADVLQL